MKSNSEIIIYQSPAGNIKIDVRMENETVWLTQKLMAELFQTTVPNINMHLKSIYEEEELAEGFLNSSKRG
ncbi:MAG: hydroxyacid dehydrogenase, partial [Candidatus Omnitrophica bacterium]|nr:hydroxyacid dehydrogenase [Candidatus Omnitrophota bacterium]